MKQRKKIKYVEKQPPDKTVQVANQTADRTLPRETERRNNEMSKVEERERKHQAYLISQGEVHGPRKQGRDTHVHRDQQKPRYIQKNEGNREKNYRGRVEQIPQLSQHHQSSSHNDLSCIICSQEIRKKDWIWTCECCCISMHLKCIKTWIININQQLDKKSHFIYSWKCPQCQFQYNQPMPKYYCFCGKHLNPEYQRDLQPHSCGERCNKKRGAFCPHPCPDFCHSGKCKPCDFQGSIVTCQCGKSQRTVRCSEERQSFQCGKKCQKILNCHNHKCQRNCHSGECMPCKKKHMVSCFCGHSQDIIDCSLPSYSCDQICNQILDCGFHKCQEKCHPGKCSPCVKTPQKQKTCPCGKYEIQMLTGDPQYRKSCEDNIPVCGMPCSKKLECGHVCPRSCHEGPCANCKVSVEQACSCGLQSRKLECWRKNKEPFKCQSICKKKRSCAQHLCNEVCCRFRTSPFTENHPCELTCNKKLNCERHQCGQACHIGLCKKCPVIYSQPQPCPCGATFLRPPIICGTLAPECNGVCGKQMACGHKCQNTCHYGPCRCYESVEVSCRCGREKIKTTCGREALCLNKCQKILECGHKCDLQCHLGTCEQAHKIAPCRKICNKERSDCRHFCPQLCHPGQLCQSFSCEAETLIKCQCGHRQTMSLCGAVDHHKTHKSIICNKKCQNLKRFDFFYKGKQMYYPGNMVQFAFKNYVFLQNLQARLQQFVLHSQQHFIQIEFKFTDNLSKLLLTNLFENHYHLNTHFYKYRKYAAFTLMQSEYTMIPKPTLTNYCKMITQGTIKHGSLPFQFTISFECQHKDKTELILKSLKAYLHKYYGERNSKIFSLHFWSQADGEDALKFLEYQNQMMEFKCSINMAKNEEEVDESEIYQQEVKQTEKIEGEPTQQLIQKPDISPENISSNQLQRKVIKKSPPKTQQADPSSTAQAPKKIQQKKSQAGPKLIVRKGVPNFKKNDYPDAKQNIQDIYLMDQDELYNEKIDWQSFVQTLISKKFGPEAIEWRIRCLLMISSFHPVDNHVFYEQFSKLVNFYNKNKQSAMRILQIQRIDSKSVKKQMSESGIYLSDHEPEMLAYLQLFNYHSTEKISLQLPDIIRNTREIEKCHQILISIEKKDAESFYHHFNSSDYILSCTLIPFIHELRESILEEITKGQRVSSINLSKHLLFDSDAQFIQFAQQNGLKIDLRQSKSTKASIYYLKQGLLKPQGVKKNDFLKKVQDKRDKKFFLVQPEELVNDQYFTRSFFAFGDFKESLSPKYMLALVKLLKERE